MLYEQVNVDILGKSCGKFSRQQRKCVLLCKRCCSFSPDLWPLEGAAPQSGIIVTLTYLFIYVPWVRIRGDAVWASASAVAPTTWLGPGAPSRAAARHHGVGRVVGTVREGGRAVGLRVGRAGGLASEQGAKALAGLAEAAAAGPAGGHAEKAGLGVSR